MAWALARTSARYRAVRTATAAGPHTRGRETGHGDRGGGGLRIQGITYKGFSSLPSKITRDIALLPSNITRGCPPSLVISRSRVLGRRRDVPRVQYLHEGIHDGQGGLGRERCHKQPLRCANSRLPLHDCHGVPLTAAFPARPADRDRWSHARHAQVMGFTLRRTRRRATTTGLRRLPLPRNVVILVRNKEKTISYQDCHMSLRGGEAACTSQPPHLPIRTPRSTRGLTLLATPKDSESPLHHSVSSSVFVTCRASCALHAAKLVLNTEWMQQCFTVFGSNHWSLLASCCAAHSQRGRRRQDQGADPLCCAVRHEAEKYTEVRCMWFQILVF